MKKTEAVNPTTKKASKGAGDDSLKPAKDLLSEAAQKLEEKARERRARVVKEIEEGRGRPAQMSFFSGDENKKPIPNLIARTPLFAPIRPGRRKSLDNEILPTHENNIEIRYTGKQLDQADCDVFMQTLFLLQGKELGEPHIINRSDLLKALGKSDGGPNYKWLDDTFGRLVGAQLSIESALYKGRVTLVSKWIEDKATGQYAVTVDEDIKKLFGGDKYTLVDWQRRLRIERRVDLAKWLQNWICSHEKGLQRWTIDKLYTLSQYSSPKRKFREALDEALTELDRVGVIVKPEFYDKNTKIRWTRL